MSGVEPPSSALRLHDTSIDPPVLEKDVIPSGALGMVAAEVVKLVPRLLCAILSRPFSLIE